MKQFHHWISTSQHTFHCMRRFVFQANLIRIGCVVLSILSLSLLNSGCKSPTELGPSTPDGPNVVKPFKVKPLPQDIDILALGVVSAPVYRGLTLAEYILPAVRQSDSTSLTLDTSGTTPILRGRIVLAPVLNPNEIPNSILQRLFITIDSMPINGLRIKMDEGQFKLLYRSKDGSQSIMDSTEIRKSFNSDDNTVLFGAWKSTDNQIGLQFYFKKELWNSGRKEFAGWGTIFIRYGK
jgi:hypothetical protein